jgi:hypothetical protein
VQGTCVFDTGCRGARLLVWLILNDRVHLSFIAGVVECVSYGEGGVYTIRYAIHTQCVSYRERRGGEGCPSIYIHAAL